MVPHICGVKEHRSPSNCVSSKLTSLGTQNGEQRLPQFLTSALNRANETFRDYNKLISSLSNIPSDVILTRISREGDAANLDEDTSTPRYAIYCIHYVKGTESRVYVQRMDEWDGMGSEEESFCVISTEQFEECQEKHLNTPVDIADNYLNEYGSTQIECGLPWEQQEEGSGWKIHNDSGRVGPANPELEWLYDLSNSLSVIDSNSSMGDWDTRRHGVGSGLALRDAVLQGNFMLIKGVNVNEDASIDQRVQYKNALDQGLTHDMALAWAGIQGK